MGLRCARSSAMQGARKTHVLLFKLVTSKFNTTEALTQSPLSLTPVYLYVIYSAITNKQRRLVKQVYGMQMRLPYSLYYTAISYLV